MSVPRMATAVIAVGASLQADYPWTRTPLVVCAPMRLLALPPLAVAVSAAGGLGFLGNGNDTSSLEVQLQECQFLLTTSHPIAAASPPGFMPIGVGFLVWGADLSLACSMVEKYRPCAVWLFAARSSDQMQEWTQRIRQACPGTKVWIQVGTVKDALETTEHCNPDVLVVQGTDAGGHGLSNGGASLISLLPEVRDALAQATSRSGSAVPKLVAAGGISDARAAAASIVLGADGICLGTRFLACTECTIAPGYQAAVLAGRDGGASTVRSSVYDQLRGTTDWPPGYGGRGLINQSWRDALAGMSPEENKSLYEKAVKTGDQGWGEHGRLTTYAGTGVGLVKRVQSAKEIVDEIVSGTQTIFSGQKSRL